MNYLVLGQVMPEVGTVGALPPEVGMMIPESMRTPSVGWRSIVTTFAAGAPCTYAVPSAVIGYTPLKKRVNALLGAQSYQVSDPTVMESPRTLPVLT